MAESSFTIEQLNALESAIADGALRVKYTDKEVEYRSLEEMLKIRSIMREALGIGKPCKKNVGLFGGKRLIMDHTKGLD